jgi:ABC-type glutathione transport system ATPase component
MIAGADYLSILELQNLSKTYHTKSRAFGKRSMIQALAGATLKVKRGSLLAIVGESGCGKSTLARCAAGLERVDSGEILLEGTRRSDVRGRGLRSALRLIQVVFQDSPMALNPAFLLEDAVAEPLRIRGWNRKLRRARALELMEQVGLPAWSGRRPGQLSSGQRRRLLLARAIASEPRVVFLDEVLSGLDMPVQAQMIELIQKLRSAFDITFVLITHDLRLARASANELAVMHQGSIVEHGSAAEVIAAPRSPATLKLLQAIPPWPPEAATSAQETA